MSTDALPDGQQIAHEMTMQNAMFYGCTMVVVSDWIESGRPEPFDAYAAVQHRLRAGAAPHPEQPVTRA